jgi:UDP-N-acetylglucosamine 2-epimerase (non-hydrolysing)
LRTSTPSQEINRVIENSKGLKRIVLTTHRRESFGETMGGNLESLRDFVKKRKDTCLIFPVHPNPNVKAVTNSILADQERVFLLDPLDYVDFVTLMKKAWLIVSDSGGIQEEAPSLGKPLLILRENTERPEVLESRVAKLVGNNPRRLGILLEENYAIETWIQSVKRVQNPFGDGTAGRKIVDLICKNRLFNGK